MHLRTILVIAVCSLLAGSASAGVINVAAGQPVILNGDYGVLTNFCCGWNPAAPLAAGSTLVDEILKPPATVWQNNTVWWDATNPGSANNSIEIDLGANFFLVGFNVQADDNDTYRIELQDALNNWITVWDIPAVGGFGMQSRPNPFDPDAMFLLGAAFETDRVRFTATGGDGFFSVSEIRAFVPEPGTTSLLLLGLTGLLGAFGARRRR